MEAAEQTVIILKGPVYASEIRETKMKRRDDRLSCRLFKAAVIRRSFTFPESDK